MEREEKYREKGQGDMTYSMMRTRQEDEWKVKKKAKLKSWVESYIERCESREDNRQG